MGGQLNIHMGALADPIKQQLNDQGLCIGSGYSTDNAQKAADAITRLHLSGILTDGETNKARDRLFKVIKKHVERL